MTSAAPPIAVPALERRVVLLVAGVQFVNILDFIIVMPLGPDFARGLGIPVSTLGLIGGSYTLAAAASGVAGSLFLDRFDRRKALGWALAGLVLATLSASLATGLRSLMAARLAAGMFGGPATSLAIAAVTDIVPPERRGRALGTVMGAFSVASVLGVPAGLELARLFGWRMPFICVAALGVVVAGLAVTLMPSLPPPPARAGSGNLLRAERQHVLGDPLARTALIITLLTTLGVFAIVPNIAAFVQFNRHYPREDLGMLYLVGGTTSFIALRYIGRLVDTFGAFRLVAAGALVHSIALWTGIIHPVESIGVLVFFVTYMLSSSLRIVPSSSLSTRVPLPTQRARFMSTQSAVQHAGAALGAMLSAWVLVETPSGALANMDRVATAAMLVALLIPLFTYRLEKGVQTREALLLTED